MTAARPQAVVVWATAPDSGAVVRALRDRGYRGKLLLDPGAVTEETLSGPDAAAMEGVHVVHPRSLGASSLADSTAAGIARRDFGHRYVRRYGTSSGFAPYASDAVQLVVTAARLADSVDRGRLRASLESQYAEGMADVYAFSTSQHGGMEADSLGDFVVAGGSWSRVS